jgi:antitoxin HicB
MQLVHRQPIPQPSALQPGEVLIAVPIWIAPKLAPYIAMSEQSLSNSDLARRLHVTETVVRRMLDPDHATKSTKLEAALKVVGKNLYIIAA